VTRWQRLLHRLGFHSVDRCPSLHSWEWVDGRWVAGVPEPVERPRLVGLPTGEMEPPRKLPPVAPPTTLIRAQPPPGRHRPEVDRIRPPDRRRDG
jgi:hypothetical protein